VDDRFFDKHEYNALTPDQKKTLRLKRLKRGHVGKSHTGSGNKNVKNNGKSVTIKSRTRSIAGLSTKIDKFSSPDDNEDEDESSYEEEGASNRSNADLTRKSKRKKKRDTNWKANLSAFTMRLGSVGHVGEVNRSDLDSHADWCVCGKEVLVLNNFDREVTVAGWDPEGETQPLSSVSAEMGYTVPESGKTVLLIADQSIFSPSLSHNLLSTMQMRLYDVIVNETPKFQHFNPTILSHSISVRGDNIEDDLLIPLELHGVVSWFPTFKPTQLEFETCDRYELTYESPEYEPSTTTFHDQEAGMVDSWGNIKVSGDFHPKRRQVCSLRQKEEEIKHLSSKYSDTSAKLQDLSAVLYDGALLAELDENNLNLNVSMVKSEMRDKGGIYAATLTKNWGIVHYTG
jgi:transcription initiation factor TFIIIB Brf1 subunit/transcription initiation factor TFIIB